MSKPNRTASLQALQPFLHYYSLRELPRTLRVGLFPGAVSAFGLPALLALLLALPQVWRFAFHSAAVAAELDRALPHFTHAVLIELCDWIRMEIYRWTRTIFICFVSGTIVYGGVSRLGADLRSGKLPGVITDANAAP